MTDDQLENLQESGGAPETRVKDATSARNIANGIVRNNKKRDQRNTLVKGLVDGNAPYSQAQLNKAGQKYRSNFNSGQALSFLQTSFTAYYDLFAEVPTYATVTCRSGNPEQDAEWSKIITDQFFELQKKNPCFDYGVQLSQHEMVLYGSGPHVFERDDDWVSYPKKHSRVLLDNNEPSDITRWTKCVIREEFTPAELYAYISNPEVAAKRGWDVVAVRKAILMSKDEYARYPEDWETAQQQLRNNDLEFTNPDRTISVARLLFKEFPKGSDKVGKISEQWVDLNHETGFLFKQTRKYDSWKQIISPFMLDRGDGTYHSIKGIGVRMYSYLMAKERLNNSVVDNAFVMASLHIRNSQSGSITPDSMVHMGPFTIWKSQFEPMGFNQVSGAIDSALAVSKTMDADLQTNLAQFRPQVAQPQGNPRTAFEVAANVSQQSVLTKTGIQRYYDQLDDWHAEMYRRATTVPLNSTSETAKAAKEFRANLVALGVPKEVWGRCQVRATRTIGQGSHFLRTQTLQTLLGGIAQSLPEGGRENLMDDFIAATAGFDMVPRYNPRNRRASTMQDHEWDATQENSSMRLGNEVILTDTQNDVVHAQTHMVAVAEGFASLEQGASPDEVLVFGQQAMQHTAEHLAKLEGDPLRQQELAQLTQRFEVLVEQLNQIQELVPLQQEANAVQEGSDPETQMKQARVQQDMEIQRQRAEQDMAIRQAQAAQQMQLADATTANQISNSQKSLTESQTSSNSD